MNSATWRRYTLGEVIDLFDHKRVPLNSRERQTRQGPYPYYGAQGVIDSVDGFLFDGEFILVAEDGENLNSKKLPLALRARGKFWVNNHAHVLRGKPDIVDDRFLLAAINSADIKPFVTGAAQPKLSQANLRQIELLLPPLNQQRRIAGILSAYDDLIENCERRIRVLDEMARSLYREWFVDRAPTSWKRMPLVDVVDINPKVKLPKDQPVTFVSMSGLGTQGMLIHEMETRTAPSGSRFQNGDTLFARITPCLENGKTGFVNFLPTAESGACGSTEFIVMRGSRVPPEYVYCLARSDGLRAHAIKSMSGATGRQRVQEACFDTFMVALPPAEALDRFVAIVRPSFDLAHKLGERAKNLRATRDMLLPRLFSGQLSVDDAA